MIRSAWLGMALVMMMVGLPILYFSQTDNTFRNFRVVEENVFYRSGQLSPEVFQRVMKEYGIQTVITFRGGNRKGERVEPNLDEKQFCEENGLLFVRIEPKHWVAKDGEVAADDNVDEFIEVVKKRKPVGPILVHCYAGIHRTGTFTAVYRMEFNGWSSAEAIREMEEGGFLIEEGGPDMIDYISNYIPRHSRNQ